MLLFRLSGPGFFGGSGGAPSSFLIAVGDASRVDGDSAIGSSDNLGRLADDSGSEDCRRFALEVVGDVEGAGSGITTADAIGLRNFSMMVIPLDAQNMYIPETFSHCASPSRTF